MLEKAFDEHLRLEKIALRNTPLNLHDDYQDEHISRHGID